MLFLQTAFEWFTEGITDLEYETQSNLFTSRMLKFDVSKISRKGWIVFFLLSHSLFLFNESISLHAYFMYFHISCILIFFDIFNYRGGGGGSPSI